MVVKFRIHPELRKWGAEIFSGMNLVRVLTGTAILLGFILFLVMVSDLKNVQERALQLHQESHSLHRSMMGSADRLDRVSTTFKKSTGHGKKPFYRIELGRATEGDLENFVTVVTNLGFDPWDGANKTWSIMWSVGYPSTVLSSTTLNHQQLVNHLPGMTNAFSSKALAMSRSRFMPVTFILPGERNDFLKYSSVNPSTMWIQKDPSRTLSPVMLESFSDLDLDKKEHIVQEYVLFSPLVDRHRFDLGIFVLVTSLDPLRAYVYKKEWVIRYATEEHDNTQSLRDVEKFLIQENNFFTTSDMPSLKASYDKYNFNNKECLLTYLESMFLLPDRNELEKKIDQIVAETLEAQRVVALKSFNKYRGHTKGFFELMRYNIVLDIRMEPFLVDVDIQPDISSNLHPELSVTFEQLLFDAMSLLGIGSLRHYPLQNSGSSKSMVLDGRDLQVFSSQCIAPECKDCSIDICQLCAHCMPNALREDLEFAYNEHEEKRNFRRLIPRPLHNQDGAMVMPSKNEMPPKDYVLDLWFRGKCIQDETWCS